MSPRCDSWGRALACAVCGGELTPGGPGRPRRYCTKPRCNRIRQRARNRTACPRCGCPLLFADERLRALCGPCLREVAGQLPLLEASP